MTHGINRASLVARFEGMSGWFPSSTISQHYPNSRHETRYIDFPRPFRRFEKLALLCLVW